MARNKQHISTHLCVLSVFIVQLHKQATHSDQDITFLTVGVHLHEPGWHQGHASVHRCLVTGSDRCHATYSHAGQR